MSPESVVPTSLATALLTEGSGGATDPESASGQEGAIAGPLSAASYSQPCTLPPACSQNTGLVQGSGTGRGVPMPLSMPPCPGLKVEDSAASLSRPLRKGGCGTPAGPPSFPRTSHHYPPTPVPGCPKQGWPPLASRSRPISGRWANTRALESCTTLLTVAFDLTPGPFCGWLVLGMAHVTSLNHLGAWSPHGAARDPKAWRPTCWPCPPPTSNPLIPGGSRRFLRTQPATVPAHKSLSPSSVRPRGPHRPSRTLPGPHCSADSRYQATVPPSQAAPPLHCPEQRQDSWNFQETLLKSSTDRNHWRQGMTTQRTTNGHRSWSWPLLSSQGP